MEQVKIKQLRALLAEDCTIWIEDEDGICLEHNENTYLSTEYDDCSIEAIYPTRFRSIGNEQGIVIQI